MNDEEAFLLAIVANPKDSAPRLVYADWLEERADVSSQSRAEYLRVECALDGLEKDNPKRRRLQDRLWKLRNSVGDEWWRWLDYARVEYCVEFEYACPQRWDNLRLTEDPAIRHCAECDRNVHYCENPREAENLADAGECVAIDSRRARIPLQTLRTIRGTRRLLGRLAPSFLRRLPLSERGSPKDYSGQ
jgi:uncharacterized protein (TIGR02996 family)